jgi:hypothetical protein
MNLLISESNGKPILPEFDHCLEIYTFSRILSSGYCAMLLLLLLHVQRGCSLGLPMFLKCTGLK